MSTTPYMSLLLPIPTITLGPEYAVENNTAFELVDSHNHTDGQGVRVPTNGLIIDNDLLINQFNLDLINSTRFTDTTTPLAGVFDIRSLYVSGGNLYYNNQLGQQVQITAGAALNAGSIGGIGGDYTTSGAAVYYLTLTNAYYFTSSGNVFANMRSGSVKIYVTGTSTFGITFAAPAGLGADYTLTLPLALPVSGTSLVGVSNTGAMSFINPDNASLEVNGAVLQIKDQGVTQFKLAPRTISPSVVAGGVAISLPISFGVNSTTPTVVPNSSATLITTGRPVRVSLQPIVAGTPASLNITNTIGSPGFTNGCVQVYNGATLIGEQVLGYYSAVNSGSQFGMAIPPSLSIIDETVNGIPGTYVYSLKIYRNMSIDAIALVSIMNISNCNLVAYEI